MLGFSWSQSTVISISPQTSLLMDQTNVGNAIEQVKRKKQNDLGSNISTHQEVGLDEDMLVEPLSEDAVSQVILSYCCLLCKFSFS